MFLLLRALLAGYTGKIVLWLGNYDILTTSGKHATGKCLCPASSQAFSVVFRRAVERASPGDSLQQRVANLTNSITFSVCQYTARGLFERDKLTYLAQLTFQVKAN